MTVSATEYPCFGRLLGSHFDDVGPPFPGSQLTHVTVTVYGHRIRMFRPISLVTYFDSHDLVIFSHINRFHFFRLISIS